MGYSGLAAGLLPALAPMHNRFTHVLPANPSEGTDLDIYSTAMTACTYRYSLGKKHESRELQYLKRLSHSSLVQMAQKNVTKLKR